MLRESEQEILERSGQILSFRLRNPGTNAVGPPSEQEEMDADGHSWYSDGSVQRERERERERGREKRKLKSTHFNS